MTTNNNWIKMAHKAWDEYSDKAEQYFRNEIEEFFKERKDVESVSFSSYEEYNDEGGSDTYWRTSSEPEDFVDDDEFNSWKQYFEDFGLGRKFSFNNPYYVEEI